MNLLYLIKAKAVVPLATQITAAAKYGFKPEEATSNSGYGGHRVYLDQRMSGQKLGDWYEELIRALHKGDVVHVYDLTVFGSKEGMIAEKLAAIGDKGAAVRIMATDQIIRPTPDAIAAIRAMRDARQAVGTKRARLARLAKLKPGVDQGGAPFRYTPEEIEIVKAAWLRGKTQAEVGLLAEKGLGRPVSYSNIFRWSKGQEDTRARKGWAPWPPMGSEPKPKPVAKPKRRAKKKAKRR